MALSVEMELEPAARGEHFDRYYVQEDDWFIEIRVPRGTKMTSADIHFEFPEQSELKRKT